MNFKIQRKNLGTLVTHKKGFAFKSKDYTRTGVPVVRVSNFTWDSISTEDLRFVSNDTANSNKVVSLNKYDVIIATVGSWPQNPASIVGKVVRVPQELSGSLLNQNTVQLRVITDNVIDQRYLYIALKNNEFSEYLISKAQGSANQASITLSDIFSYEIPWGSSLQRKFIVDIIDSINDKIIINGHINQTLEQMAQALFKSWFVDFEPVKAKIAVLEADGSQEEATLGAMTAISGKDADALVVFEREDPQQYGELKTTAELFPSAMQEGTLRDIPASWTLSEIRKEIDIVGGGTPSTKTPEFWNNGDINWTTPKDLSGLKDKILLHTERKITKAGLSKISSGLLPVNTVLMSSRAPVGYLAIAKIPVAINQGYIAMRCNNELSPEFLLQWCTANMPEIVSRASGTTFSEISKKNFNSIHLVKPPVNLVKRYTKQVSAIYSLIENNAKENNSLTKIRDILLPRLLSGEITLPEGEPAISEAANV